MIGFPLQKSPSETLDRLVTFAHKLAPTDRLFLPVTVSADPGLDVAVVGLTADLRGVTVRVGGGGAGTDYAVVVLATSGQSDVVGARFLVEVREPTAR